MGKAQQESSARFFLGMSNAWGRVTFQGKGRRNGMLKRLDWEGDVPSFLYGPSDQSLRFFWSS
jgi:hypothetical protein